MQPQNDEPTDHKLLQSRTTERVIRPLGQVNAPVSPVLSPNNIASHYPAAPVEDAFVVPSLSQQTAHPDQAGSKGRSEIVALQHKSLLILAVAGLILTVISIILAIRFNSAIGKAELLNDPAVAAARRSLSFSVISILISIATYCYLLFSKNRGVVETVLKIIIVLQVIAVFGAFFGFGRQGGVGLFIDGFMLLYTFITLLSIRSHQQ